MKKEIEMKRSYEKGSKAEENEKLGKVNEVLNFPAGLKCK